MGITPKRIAAWRQAAMRNVDRRFTAVRARESRPVRAALPWRMPRIARRYFARTVAQHGRADGTPSGRRFDSGSSTSG